MYKYCGKHVSWQNFDGYLGGKEKWPTGRRVSGQQQKEEAVLFVFNQSLYLKDQFLTNFQHMLGIVLFCHFIEKFNDISKVHVVVKDNVTIVFN